MSLLAPDDAVGERIPGLSPSSRVDISWDDFVYVHLLWPLGVQIAMSLIFGVIVAPLYRRKDPKGRFRSFVRLHVGSRDRPEAPRAQCFVVICMLQMVSSLITVADWARNTYTRSTSTFSTYLVLVTGTVDLVHWLATRLRGEFSVLELWSLMGIIDAVTIVPKICSGFIHLPYATDFITLRFFRAYCMLSGYHQIMATGYFKHTGVMLQMLLLVTLRIYCLIIPMSGLLLTLEVLGDPAILSDSFIITPGGDRLSFWMAVNWVIVSIATLGDGSFYPRTVLGRCVWSVFLVVAVGYVFYIQFAFGQAWVRNREGSGCYKPRKHRRHLVVFLQVHGYAVQLSSVVLGLLSEALNMSTDEDWPDIVFFCESYWDEHTAADATYKTLLEFLKAKSFGSLAREHVFFIVGQANLKEDLERAALGEAALTYIVPDVNTDSPERDDEVSIITALNLKRYFPNVRLRLMLLLPQSKDLAVQSGIMMERCFSVRELKAHLLAQNVRCHGLLPLLTGLFKSVDAEQEAILLGSSHTQNKHEAEDSYYSDSSEGSIPPLPRSGSSRVFDDHQAVPDWVLEYVHGVSRGIFGFELAGSLSSLCFGDLVVAVNKACGAVLVAVLLDGNIQLCPQDPYWRPQPKHQVCFAIANNLAMLDPVRDRTVGVGHWRETLLASRDVLAGRMESEGPHVTATKLMGKQLKEAILRAEEGVALEEGDMDRQVSDDSVKSGTSLAASTMFGRRGSSFCLSGAASVMSGRGMTPTEAAEEKSIEAVATVRRLRQQQCAQDMVVVIVCQGDVWQQVRAFVASLRARYQPVFRPVVIMAPSEPPPRLLNGVQEGVLTLVGSSQRVQSLVEAGVLEASSVVVMAGQMSLEDSKRVPPAKDARVLLCARMLECWCGVSKNEVFTTYELLDTNSVAALPHVMPKPSVCLESFIQEKAFNDDALKEEEEWEVVEAKVQTRNPHVNRKSVASSTAAQGDAVGKRRSTDNLMRSSKHAVSSIAFDLRFAAGQVLTPEIWGCMLGRMYYNPAVIELSEAFIMPQRRGQHAYPWQIRPPKNYVEDVYEELIVDLALGYWSKSERPEQERGQRANLMPKEGPAVALALYRKRELDDAHGISELSEGTGSNRYLVLGPPGHTILKESDWIMVVASRKFGKKAYQMGLLRGSAQAMSRSRSTATTPSPQGASHGEFTVQHTASSRRWEPHLATFREDSSDQEADKTLRSAASEWVQVPQQYSSEASKSGRNGETGGRRDSSGPAADFERKLQATPPETGAAGDNTPTCSRRPSFTIPEGAAPPQAVCELGPMGFACTGREAPHMSEASAGSASAASRQLESRADTGTWPWWRTLRHMVTRLARPDLDATLTRGNPETDIERDFIVVQQ